MPENTPPPADLAALKGRLEQEANEFAMGGGTRLPADLRLAARCVAAVDVMREALKPFACGGVMDAISREDYSIMRERIVDWHGPSDFKAAATAHAAVKAEVAP